MSLQLMLNFDLIPGATYEAAQYWSPLLGRGLEPYLTPYSIAAVATGNNSDSVGVTGRDEEKMANGSHALCVYRRSTAYRPHLAFNGTDRPMASNAAHRYTLGFRFKIASDSVATLAINTVLISGPSANIMVLDGNRQVIFMNQATGVVLDQNREYYIEVMNEYAGNTPGANFTPTWTLFIDGTQVRQVANTSYTYTATTYYNFLLGQYLAAPTSTNNTQRWLFADIYITDGLGEAPHNGRLGPQRIRLAFPDEVVENTWTPTGGSDPLDLIGQTNGRDDAKYLTSPEDDSPSSYKFGFPTNPRSIVNGVFFFGRIKREAGAARNLLVEGKKADGSALFTGAPKSLGTTFADTLLHKLAPLTAADANNIKDSVLQNATITIKAPVT